MIHEKWPTLFLSFLHFFTITKSGKNSKKMVKIVKFLDISLATLILPRHVHYDADLFWTESLFTNFLNIFCRKKCWCQIWSYILKINYLKIIVVLIIVGQICGYFVEQNGRYVFCHFLLFFIVSYCFDKNDKKRQKKKTKMTNKLTNKIGHNYRKRTIYRIMKSVLILVVG